MVNMVNVPAKRQNVSIVIVSVSATLAFTSRHHCVLSTALPNHQHMEADTATDIALTGYLLSKNVC